MSRNEKTSAARTPGPWRADWFDEDRCWILDDQSNYLAEIVTEDECGFVVPKKQQHANARLIAAAPELLDDLRTLVEMAHSVAANWDSGDLARAVRNLEYIATETERTLARAGGTPEC